VSTLSASAASRATSGGAAHLPLTTSALSSFAPRASAQPFQTYTGTRWSLSLLNSSRMGGTPTPSMR
jgi:hypothetical protein